MFIQLKEHSKGYTLEIKFQSLKRNDAIPLARRKVLKLLSLSSISDFRNCQGFLQNEINYNI